jgi:hypothetical protein
VLAVKLDRLVRAEPAFTGAGTAGLFCGPFLRKGEVSAYVGLIQNLKDLKDALQGHLAHKKPPPRRTLQ